MRLLNIIHMLSVRSQSLLIQVKKRSKEDRILVLARQHFPGYPCFEIDKYDVGLFRWYAYALIVVGPPVAIGRQDPLCR